MSLRGAVLCSAVLHAGFLVLRPSGAIVPPRETLYPLEVSYVVLERERPAPASVPRAEKGRLSRADDAPAPAPEKTAPAEPAPRPAPEPPKRVDPPRPEPAEPPARQVSPPPAPAARVPAGAAALPAGELTQIRHKERVREHLRVRMRYPESSLQGTLRLRVTLSADGRLRDAVVAEASDPRLSAVALRDARAAGPYPRFPKEMGPSDAEYEFLVQYRRGEGAP